VCVGGCNFACTLLHAVTGSTLTRSQPTPNQPAPLNAPLDTQPLHTPTEQVRQVPGHPDAGELFCIRTGPGGGGCGANRRGACWRLTGGVLACCCLLRSAALVPCLGLRSSFSGPTHPLTPDTDLPPTTMKRAGCCCHRPGRDPSAHRVWGALRECEWCLGLPSFSDPGLPAKLSPYYQPRPPITAIVALMSPPPNPTPSAHPPTSIRPPTHTRPPTHPMQAASVPAALRWLPKVSLIKNAFQALVINEMEGLEFDADDKVGFGVGAGVG